MVYLDFPDLVRGDTITIPISFTVNGAVVDITGWVIYMTVKQFENDPDSDAVIAVTVSVHNSPTQGETTIVLSNVDTSTIAGTYWYDFGYTDLSGEKTTVLIGRMTFYKNITQRTSPPPPTPPVLTGVTRLVSTGGSSFALTAGYFLTDSTSLYINGLYQSWGIDYTENSNRQGITTTVPVPSGYIVEIRYVPSLV